MTVKNTVEKRKNMEKGLVKFLATQFPSEYPEEDIENFKPPTKKCFIERGRALLNDVLEDKYVAIINNVEKPQDCLKHCKEHSEKCSAWTFDEEDKFCYLKTHDMATRFSDTWNSYIYSGLVDKCASSDMDISWSRQCKKEQYKQCIADIRQPIDLIEFPCKCIKNNTNKIRESEVV